MTFSKIFSNLFIYRPFIYIDSFAAEFEIELLPVVGSDDAVNIEVGRGVDYQENLGDVAQIYLPNLKPS